MPVRLHRALATAQSDNCMTLAGKPGWNLRGNLVLHMTVQVSVSVCTRILFCTGCLGLRVSCLGKAKA